MRSVHTLCLAVALLAVHAGCAPSPTVHMTEPLGGNWRIAILPLANYSTNREAPPRVYPLLAMEFRSRLGFTVADPGLVEEALADEPWLLSDLIPPDLADSLARRLDVDALVLGSVLDYEYRDVNGTQVPTVAISLRLIEVPGGELLWSAVHSRDGADRETVFGMGRTDSLPNLARETVQEMLGKFPNVDKKERPGVRRPPRRGVES